MKLAGRLLVVLVMSLVSGLLAAVAIAQLTDEGWLSLGIPPEPASNILATSPYLVIETIDGNRFRSCGKDCWESFEAADLPPASPAIEPCTGVEPPKLDALSAIETECEFVGVQAWERAFAIDELGNVYVYENYIGEWAGIDRLMGGFAASLFIFLLGVFIIMLLSFKDLLSSLKNRALRESQDEGLQPRT